MKSTLKCNISQSGKVTTLMMSGRLDEYSNLPVLESSTGQYIFDLKGLTFINSVGIANWTRWMKSMIEVDPKIQIDFRRVTQQLIKPMNEFQGFLPPKFSVESFYVPYFCETCTKNHDIEYKRGFNYDSSDFTKIINSMAACPKCGGSMEPDIVPTKYFQFLKFAVFSK